MAALGLGLAVAQGYVRDQPIVVAAGAALACIFVFETALRESSRARAAGAAIAVAGVLFGGYLLGAQLVSDALCPWCLATDLVLDALAVACLLRLAGNPHVGLRIARDDAHRGRLYRR